MEYPPYQMLEGEHIAIEITESWIWAWLLYKWKGNVLLFLFDIDILQRGLSIRIYVVVDQQV